MHTGTKIPVKNSIATRMLVMVLALYLLVATGVTLTQIWLEYRYQKTNITHDLAGLESAFEDGLAVTLWGLDEKALKATLEGMLRIPTLVGVKVSDTEGTTIALGGMVAEEGRTGRIGLRVNLSGLSERELTLHDDESSNFEMFERRFPITYDHDGESVLLGEAIIYSNSSTIYRNMKLQIGMLAAHILLTLLIFSLGLWWAVNRYLRRPLGILTNATSSISLSNLGSFSLDTKSSRRDEIKALEVVLTSMVADLHNSILKRERAEACLKRAQEIGHIGTWDWDQLSGELIWSDEVYHILGFSPGEVEPSYDLFLRMVHPEDREFLNSSVEAALHEKKSYELDCRIVQKNGTERFVHAQGEVQFDNDSQPLRMVGLFQDITERKRIEHSLHENEEKYRGMVMNLMEGFYRVTLDGKLQDYNVAFAEILGLDPSKDHTGIALPDFWQNPADRKVYTREIKAQGYIKNYIVNARKFGGEKIIVMVNARLIKDENGKPLLIEGSFLDVTEWKESEKSLIILSSAIEQAGESILITDREGIIEYVNPAFTQLTGYSSDEAIGQTPRMLKSGNQDDVFYEAMWNSITSGKVWHGKVIDRKKDGAFYPANLTISPVYSNSETHTAHYSHFVGLQSDLSELEDMERQFQQAQKMEAIGTLVGGIAHDFNNILAGITGSLYLAKRRIGEMPDVLRKLDTIESLSFRAADMIQQLLTFARKGQINIKQMPFTPFIEETVRLLRPSVPENVTFQRHLCSDPLHIRGDGTQLHQVLMNLINNASDAVEGMDDPRITVRLEAFHGDDLFTKNHPSSTGRDFAHLSIEDNGCGIAEDQVEHLFEPFYTTKEAGRGTGLGLAMVFGAIKSHDGYVEVESAPGDGSTFHIYIPLYKPQELPDLPRQEKKVAEGEGETILLADDEPHVRDLLAEILETLGYRVLQAEDGLEAIQLFEAHHKKIDLAILDVVMPHCGGMKLAKKIRKITPSLPILFLTGYDKEHALGSKKMEQSEIVTKPVQFDALSHIIRQLLD